MEDPTSASWLGGNTKPWMYIILWEQSTSGNQEIFPQTADCWEAIPQEG